MTTNQDGELDLRGSLSLSFGIEAKNDEGMSGP